MAIDAGPGGRCVVEIHPLAAVFPEMKPEAYKAFAADIKENGLRYEIVTHEGMIIDGRHRYRACMETGVEPRFREYQEDDLLAFIVSSNKHRRQLNAGQLAALALKIANITHGGDRKSDQGVDRRLDSVSQGEAAEILGTSQISVSRAARLEREDPVLLQQVEEGTVTLNAAIDEIRGLTPEDKRKRNERRRQRDDKGMTAQEIAERRTHRLRQIRELTQKGWNAQQIADELDVTREWVMKEANAQNIDLVDRRLRARMSPESNRVVEGIIATTAGLDVSLAVINYDDLDRELIPVWLEELKENTKHLNTLKRKLQEALHGSE